MQNLALAILPRPLFIRLPERGGLNRYMGPEQAPLVDELAKRIGFGTPVCASILQEEIDPELSNKLVGRSRGDPEVGRSGHTTVAP
jgi:hypothetical protein